MGLVLLGLLAAFRPITACSPLLAILLVSGLKAGFWSLQWGLNHLVALFVVAQAHLTLCHPIDCSTPGFPVIHCLPEFAQIHVR